MEKDKKDRIIFDPEIDNIEFENFNYQYMCLVCNKKLYAHKLFKLNHCGKEMVPFALWKTKTPLE